MAVRILPLKDMGSFVNTEVIQEINIKGRYFWSFIGKLIMSQLAAYISVSDYIFLPLKCHEELQYSM